jgi:hypothetical protein
MSALGEMSNKEETDCLSGAVAYPDVEWNSAALARIGVAIALALDAASCGKGSKKSRQSPRDCEQRLAEAFHHQRLVRLNLPNWWSCICSARRITDERHILRDSLPWALPLVEAEAKV